MQVTGSAGSNQRVRQLRRDMTTAERLLWWALKGDKTGFHFRRQHAAGPFVLDFYCDAARLCLEVDGSSHDFTFDRDAARDDFLRRWGILTLRVSAQDVMQNLAGVVEHITGIARDRPIRKP